MNFFSRYKKIFQLLLFLLTAAIIGLAIYFMFFRQPLLPPTGTEEQLATTTGQLPPAGTGGTAIIKEDQEGAGIIPTEKESPTETASGGLTKTVAITETPVSSPTISADGKNPQYYNRDDGKFYRLDDNGNPLLLSDKIFYNVENIYWSPVKNKAILEYPDGANIIYNFDTEKQITLPKHWENFNFSPNGDKIILKSIGLDVENRYLAIANDDGSGARALEYIGENGDNVYTDWSPNNQIAAMYTEGIDFDRQEVYFLGLNEENFKSTTVEGRGFNPKWSTAGDKLLYSVYSTANDLKPKLWMVEAEGDNIGMNRKSINLETWASKCVFADNDTAYCGVPETMEKGAGMFPEMAQYTKDNLYKINLKSGQTILVATPDGNYNMSNLSVSADGKNLFFSDANNGKLQKIQLK
ncbi:MAG: hypothetical protein WC415_00750 [Patescibacteria group bacterium]|jgi:Tol biopolymer transport system component